MVECREKSLYMSGCAKGKEEGSHPRRKGITEILFRNIIGFASKFFPFNFLAIFIFLELDKDVKKW